MFSKMSSVFLASFVLVVVWSAVTAHPADDSYNPYLRAYPPPPDCRSGLCPPPKRLVPDSGSNPYDVPYAARSYGEEYGEPSLCGNLCTTDTFCPEHQKCCPTTCGYACQGIVHISD